ncbi:uncharacterized protein BDW47DRAFT_103797 [Aspergillus candidus]|uniref:Uncharacterized protein n=1 Tax=Aspergillus candidus TaxID=41067 RepID=A0A2I2FEY1_ASPCN|nr:hypothetical protein BDW47DRAFT_103797 [Aspergillus candidus]PLB39170.1 hypothetical protein BDW47DRAFT_103797 [Aspergillus candidus]
MRNREIKGCKTRQKEEKGQKVTISIPSTGLFFFFFSLSSFQGLCRLQLTVPNPDSQSVGAVISMPIRLWEIRCKKIVQSLYSPARITWASTFHIRYSSSLVSQSRSSTWKR